MSLKGFLRWTEAAYFDQGLILSQSPLNVQNAKPTIIDTALMLSFGIQQWLYLNQFLPRKPADYSIMG